MVGSVLGCARRECDVGAVGTGRWEEEEEVVGREGGKGGVCAGAEGGKGVVCAGAEGRGGC